MAMMYLRREPTTDRTLTMALRTIRRDVIAYRDKHATKPAARWPWHFAESLPRKGCRTVAVDGITYRAKWLSDL